MKNLILRRKVNFNFKEKNPPYKLNFEGLEYKLDCIENLPLSGKAFIYLSGSKFSKDCKILKIW